MGNEANAGVKVFVKKGGRLVPQGIVQQGEFSTGIGVSKRKSVRTSARYLHPNRCHSKGK